MMNATPFKIHNENEFLHPSTAKINAKHGGLRPSGLKSNVPKSVIFEESTPFKDSASESTLKLPKSNRKALSNLSTSQINSRATPGVPVGIGKMMGSMELQKPGDPQQISLSIHHSKTKCEKQDFPTQDIVRMLCGFDIYNVGESNFFVVISIWSASSG